ncbi:hypothetical protein GGG16DRAFT_129648 [Schizophyllum commune]
MIVWGDYRSDHRCPISGATTNLYSPALMPYGLVDEDESMVSFREDISQMFQRGEFILAPTYKTFLETKRFAQSSGVRDRSDRDRSPRRPLTALASPDGMYRYVYIPYTDTARALQDEFKLPPQTMEDLNDGICPMDNKPFDEGSDQFPVIECHAHPYSMAVAALAMFEKRSTRLTAQWHDLVWQITALWRSRRVQPPQWFVDSPKYGLYDDALSASEATGYIPLALLHGVSKPEPIVRNLGIPDDGVAKKCAHWVICIPPDAPPPEEDHPCPEYRERRSERIAKRGHPYGRSSKPRSATERNDGPPPSPVRKARRALQTCKRDPVKNPPWWASRNGRYPTERFCSNDWAYFRFNLRLASPEYT